MPYQNEQEAVAGLNELISRLRTGIPPAGKAEVVSRLAEWAKKEFTDPEKDNSLLTRLKGILHSDRIEKGIGIRSFLPENAAFLQRLAAPTQDFKIFFNAIPNSVMKSESQLIAEQQAQLNQKIEEERQSLLEQQRVFLSMGQRLQAIQRDLLSRHPDCSSMPQIKRKVSRLGEGAAVEQALLTEYSAIQAKLQAATLENNLSAIKELMQQNVDHRDYYQGDSYEEKINNLRIEFIRQNIPILKKISDQVKSFEAPPQKVEAKRSSSFSEEEALQKIAQVLGEVLDGGSQAVTTHPGSETNLGKQVRVEYNFLPGGAMHQNIEAVKQTLIQLGLLDSNYNESHHGVSPFLVIKSPADRAFLNDPNFEVQLRKIYQEQKDKLELESFSRVLKGAIHDGEQGVIIHEGSATVPGRQVRIEYNFPPHSTNGTYNAVHFEAIQKALTQIGVEFSIPKHGNSPFIVIKPTAGNRFLNDPNLYIKFQEAYQGQLFISAVFRQLEKIQADTIYITAQDKNIAKRLEAETRLNDGIERIIELAQNGDASQGIQSNSEWLKQNQPLIDTWLNSDIVKHSIKQQLQKLTRPEQFYDRAYKASDPLLDTIMQKLLEQEKVVLASIKSMNPGGYNISLDIDNLLKKLKELDGKTRAEIVKALPALLEGAQSANATSALNQIINKVKNDPEVVALSSPQAITLAQIARHLELVNGDINYLERGMHDARRIQNSTNTLNNGINAIITLSQAGDQERGLPPYPKWLSENKQVIASWLENGFVTHETRQRLQLLVKPEAYFDRKYTAKDPLIEMVWRELLKNEATKTRFPGSYAVSTNVDSLLRKLEGIDRKPLATNQKAQEVDALLQEYKSNEKELYNMAPIEEIVNPILRDKGYLDLLTKQKQIAAAAPVQKLGPMFARVVAAVPPAPPPRQSTTPAQKIPPVPPARQSATPPQAAAVPPAPPPRSPESPRRAPVPPPRAPVPPPRADVKAAARNLFIPSQQVALKGDELKAEIQRVMQQKNKAGDVAPPNPPPRRQGPVSKGKG